MSERTPAETLTAAADKLDALLANLNGDVAGRDYYWDCDRFVEGGEVRRYVEAMNPDVGRALAALLRIQAAIEWGHPGFITTKAIDLARAILGTREDT